MKRQGILIAIGACLFLLGIVVGNIRPTQAPIQEDGELQIGSTVIVHRPIGTRAEPAYRISDLEVYGVGTDRPEPPDGSLWFFSFDDRIIYLVERNDRDER